MPYGEANVWWPIASALYDYLDLDPTLPIDEIRDAARAAASRSCCRTPIDTEVERLVDVFTHLLGYPSPIDRLEPASRAIDHPSAPWPGCSNCGRRTARWCCPSTTCTGPTRRCSDCSNIWSRRSAATASPLITAMRPGSDVVWPPHTERTTVISFKLQPLESRSHRGAGRRAAARALRRRQAVDGALRAQRRQPAVPPRAGRAHRGGWRHPRAPELAAHPDHRPARPADPASTTDPRERRHARHRGLDRRRCRPSPRSWASRSIRRRFASSTIWVC